MRKFFLVVCCLIFQSCAASSNVQPNEESKWVCYYPCEVHLHGVLEKTIKYGPPGFGETPKEDKKLTIYILILDDPINIKAKVEDALNTDDLSGVTRVQFDVNPLPKNIFKYVDQHVVVKGVLNQAILPTHYESVILTVRNLE